MGFVTFSVTIRIVILMEAIVKLAMMAAMCCFSEMGFAMKSVTLMLARLITVIAHLSHLAQLDAQTSESEMVYVIRPVMSMPVNLI
jgi:hypothetical protein